jgi:hypothetical protein
VATVCSSEELKNLFPARRKALPRNYRFFAPLLPLRLCVKLTRMDQYPFADIELARRLERTEARGNIDFVEARAKAFPDVGATWIEAGGTYAMFDGVGSPGSGSQRNAERHRFRIAYTRTKWKQDLYDSTG